MRNHGARIASTVLLLAVFFGGPPMTAEQAPAASYMIDASRSSAEFSIEKFSFGRQRGFFGKMEGEVIMSPEDPESAKVEIRIFTSSLKTGNTRRDDVVRSDDFLAVAAHPTMTFRSMHVRRRAGRLFDVTGDLTIRGVTRRVLVPVRLIGIEGPEGKGQTASFSTSFVIDRRDFNVLGSRWSGGKALLGHDVTIELSLTAQRRDRHSPPR